MKKSIDKLFIISDLADDLTSWVNEAEKMPGIKWAIGYNVRTNKECEKTIMNSYSTRGKTSEFIDRWNKTFKTCFISTR